MTAASAPVPPDTIQVLATELIRSVTSRDKGSVSEGGTAIRADADRIASENAHRIVDAATGRWLMLAAVALAAYRQLLPTVRDSGKALTILESALTGRFKAGVKTFIADRFGISEDAPADAFDRISQNFKPRGEERFGGGFTFVTNTDVDGRSVTRITRCLFDDFFRANGAPELTRIFCAVDLVWAEELHHPRYGVHFERPTSLAAGDDACRFEFSRRALSGGDSRERQ